MRFVVLILFLSSFVFNCRNRSQKGGSLLSRNSEVQFSFNKNSGDFEVHVSAALAAAGGEMRYLISRNAINGKVDCLAAGNGQWLPGTSRGTVVLVPGQSVYPLPAIGNEIWLSPADPEISYKGHGKLSPAGFAALTNIKDTFIGESCVTVRGGGENSAVTETSISNGLVSEVVAGWDGGSDVPSVGRGGPNGFGLVTGVETENGWGHSSDGRSEMKEYADACEAELGKIPTLDCFGVAKVIPITKTWPDGILENVTDSNYGAASTTCDKPVMLQNSCVPYSRFAAFTAEKIRGDKPTQWAYFCRRYEPRPEGSRFFDDVNMIGHNPNTGATCFFNSTLGASNGIPVANSDLIPGQPVPASIIPKFGDGDALKFWYPPYVKDSPGVTSVDSIRCARCHDNDAFLNSPFVAQAKTLPYGEYSDPDGPYYAVLFNKISLFDAWRPRHIMGESAEQCTSCHRIGSGATCDDFAMYAADPANSGYAGLLSDFGKTHPWMPVGRTDDGKKMPEEIQKSLNFIYQCCADPSDASCRWTPVPH